MTKTELQHYLTTHIPLTRALALEVLEVSDERVALRAPLAPNLNHRQTAFGGSVAALAVLAGWGWLHGRLAGFAPGCRLVIQRQVVDYLLPIDAEFTAECAAPAASDWYRFTRTLGLRGRGRIDLSVSVICREQLAARFQGAYVALAPDSESRAESR